MTAQNFIPKSYINKPNNGNVSFKAPSNIALVKYWGKYGEQMPQNASVSFTLSNCATTTTLFFEKKEAKGYKFEVYLDGKREINFESKITTFFERVEQYAPFLQDYSFKIETSNSFPHSSGIASSASGMSALASCLVAVEKLLGAEYTKEFIVAKSSFLSRLGSGSASRSIEGPLVVWGVHPKIDGSSQLVGVKYPYKVHENFNNYQDTILLVDKGEKQVSSTVGHNLMHNHPFAAQRFETANLNLESLITVFENGDINEFIKIVESEALQLHAMMMASSPYFILMKPNTLEIINKIWLYRAETKSNICFTLDAGANVHVLYPFSEKEEVLSFIKTQLTSFCKNGEFIEDKTGLGAMEI